MQRQAVFATSDTGRRETEEGRSETETKQSGSTKQREAERSDEQPAAGINQSVVKQRAAPHEDGGSTSHHQHPRPPPPITASHSHLTTRHVMINIQGQCRITSRREAAI